MKKVFCILLLMHPFVSAVYATMQMDAGSAPALRYDNAAGAILRTQQGSGAFSWNRLAVSLPFRYSCAAVNGGHGTLLSGFAGATAVSAIRYAGAALETSAAGICTFGVRVSLADWEVSWLRIRLPNTELRERHIVNRFYSASISCGLPAYQIRYNGDWYWGRLSLGLHDLGPFIAQPSVDAVVSIHRFRLTQWYESRITSLKLQGVLVNKNDESIASGAAQALIFQNTLYVPIATHSELSLSASYLCFSGVFSVRLTAKNQGYFLFPYRFYNRDISLSASALGFGGSYRYTAERFRFYGVASFYSIINDTGNDNIHSKQKKSFLFKGTEEKSSAPLPAISGTSLLLLHLSAGFAVTPNTELSARKIIPVPIIPPTRAKQLEEWTTGQSFLSTLIIDPLLTGLSIQLTIRL